MNLKERSSASRQTITTMNNTANSTTTKRLSTRKLVLIALMTAITCIFAPMAIPIPVSPVPISLTNLVIMISIYVLGFKDATISYIVYLLLGLVGLPVFSGFTGGLGKLAGPTGGYLIGFIFLALIAVRWQISKEQNPGRCRYAHRYGDHLYLRYRMACNSVKNVLCCSTFCRSYPLSCRWRSEDYHCDHCRTCASQPSESYAVTVTSTELATGSFSCILWYLKNTQYRLYDSFCFGIVCFIFPSGTSTIKLPVLQYNISHFLAGIHIISLDNISTDHV